MDTFGSRFKKLRLITNMTQEELANDFNKKYHYNFTKSAISQYENDKRYPEITVLIDLADYFNVSIDFLLKETKVKNNKLEEEVANYKIDIEDKTFNIDDFLNEYKTKITDNTRVIIFGKTATKRQITIIETCIEIALKLANQGEGS